jgi:acyl-CoA thioesterase
MRLIETGVFCYCIPGRATQNPAKNRQTMKRKIHEPCKEKSTNHAKKNPQTMQRKIKEKSTQTMQRKIHKPCKEKSTNHEKKNPPGTSVFVRELANVRGGSITCTVGLTQGLQVLKKMLV